MNKGKSTVRWDKPLLEKLGKDIRRRRCLLGWSQEVLADKAKMHRLRVVRIENCSVRAYADEFLKLQKVILKAEES